MRVNRWVITTASRSFFMPRINYLISDSELRIYEIEILKIILKLYNYNIY